MSQFKYLVNTRDTLKIEFPASYVENGEDNVLRRRLVIGRKGWQVDDVWVFHGRDQGDRAEHDTEIYDGVIPLVLRSDHDVLHYDAWRHYGLYHPVVKGLTLSILARSGTNPELKRTAIRPHWGIYMNWRPQS